MAARVLVVHGGRFGQSEKIARAMDEVLRTGGLDTEVAQLTAATAPDPERHSALLLVTSVRYGHLDRNAYRLAARHRSWLETVPSALVTVSLTARKPEKHDPQTHSYTSKFLQRSGWAGAVEVVAGALEYPRYALLDRLVIQFIMKLTGGPTDPSVTIEYTDWAQVRAAAERFAGQIASRTAT